MNRNPSNDSDQSGLFDQSSSDKKNQSKKKGDHFSTVGSLFDNYQLEDKGGYITREFQDFGYRLALELNDLQHKSLYMRLAKKENRVLLERALSFVADAPNVKSKARLFMWKVKQLKEEQTKKK